MTVEVLYFSGCPNHRPTVERVCSVLAELGIGALVREVEVRDLEDARRQRFLGSPTVRVDGADIESAVDAQTDYGLACRLYGASGVPPRELLVEALLDAAVELRALAADASVLADLEVGEIPEGAVVVDLGGTATLHKVEGQPS